MKLMGILLLLLWSATNVTAQLPSWSALVEQARWAANAHNIQSWRLEAVEGRPDQKRLVLDESRLLPETDPPSRQLTISLGAFLAVLEDAAAVHGAAITWTPLGDRPGALVELAAGSVAPRADLDGLSAATVKYRTNRFTLPAAVSLAIERRSTPSVRVQTVSESNAVQRGLAWARRSYRVEMTVPRTRDESIRYTVYGADARRAKPWGITLTPNFAASELFWAETFASWFPQKPEEYASTAIQMFEKGLAPVRQLVVITSKGNRNKDRLETGEVLQRVWLDVRAAGGELLPLSQGLEEFPEMATSYSEAHREWAREGETVQMVLAVFAPQPGRFERSPRIETQQILR